MARNNKRKKRFSDKKHSVKGIISLIIGIILLILLLILFYSSARVEGGGSIVIGLIGVIIMILSLIGTVVGYQGYKEKDIHYFVPITEIGRASCRERV